MAIGRNWLIAEAEKPEESRNPLVINFERAVNARKRSGDKSNGVVPRAATGTEAFNSREKHREILELMESIRDHSSIPSTFEGEIPEFAFGVATSRLIIGDKYAVADDTGKEVTGILRHASVIEQQKSAYCVFELPDSKNIVYSIELTDAELGACKSHPDTFFGRYDTQLKAPMRDSLELYDWFFKRYVNTSREQLLMNLKDATDIEELKAFSREDLLSVFCERQVYGFLQVAQSKKGSIDDRGSCESPDVDCS